ncbi:unnamed protein product, partial [Bubo scandiacus]
STSIYQAQWQVSGLCLDKPQQLPPCPMEPMPAGSKMDPLLAKAEPISHGGSTSGIMYLK